MIRKLVILAICSSLLRIGGAYANTYPTQPGVGAVFYVGEWCRTSWTNENGPGWSSVKIQLMSGIETPILDVANDIDCSKDSANTIVFKCPDVTKYSDVYFYRYIENDNPSILTYSARFVITKKFKTHGVVAATTQPVTATSVWTYSDGQVSTITYANATLKGTATKTQTLPKTAWQTGRGNFSITIKTSDSQAKQTGNGGGGGGGEEDLTGLAYHGLGVSAMMAFTSFLALLCYFSA